MSLAELVATWSKDPSTQVGAVITDSKNRVISLGFNGYPRGVEDRNESREEKLRKMIHAEENAIFFAQRDLAGATLYVTHPPCARCAAKIVQAGIELVVSQDPGDGFVHRWYEDMVAAQEMFHEAGVNYMWEGD